MIDDFSKEIEALKKSIAKSKAVNINSQVLKEQTISIVKNFFSKYHAYLSDKNLINTESISLTNNLQDLLRLAQGNNPQTKYLKLIKGIEKQVKELHIQDVSSPIIKEPPLPHNDKLIIDTIDSIIPSAALSYKQALIDINTCNHKISYRGTASELREALRETLDHLAQDKDVMSESGFKLEPNQTKPTMKQKVRYILKKRGQNDTKRLPTEKSVELVDEIIGQIARATYNRASLSTHLQTTKQEVVQIKRYVDMVFYEIFELS